MTTAPEKQRAQIDALVIDTGPLIRNDFTTSILDRVGKLYSTPAVIAEIRDAAARSRLETSWLPLLTLRTPKPASIKVVSDFSKKTGDFPVLSVTDLQLLALTYELEVELNGGDWRLRRVPGQKGISGPVPKDLKQGKQGKEEAAEKDGEERNEEKTKNVGAGSADIKYIPVTSVEEKARNGDVPAPPVGEEDLTRKLENARVLPDPAISLVDPVQDAAPTTKQAPHSPEESQSQEESESSDNSDGGWITPSNLHKHKAKDTPATSTSTKTLWSIRSALATTDFALQSVTLQMNLHLLSTKTLQRIHAIRSFVLRCHACFKITRDMSKQFCPVCGGPTLQRVSCSTDSKGEFKVYLKRNYQWNNRGNVYSLPKPSHGSASGKGVKGTLILREDQKEYEREVVKESKRKERDLLDPDYLPGILTGERRDASGRPRIGCGKGNPNTKRRGGKR